MRTHRIIAGIMVLATVVLAVLFTTPQARADAGRDGLDHDPGTVYTSPNGFTPGVRLRQPYGGCKEAIDYPHSDGADWCRAHGWTVTRRIIIRPDRWVIAYRNLPVCVVEDQVESPCRWNFGAGQPHGNGEGRAFWVNSAGVRRFVEGMA